MLLCSALQTLPPHDPLASVSHLPPGIRMHALHLDFFMSAGDQAGCWAWIASMFTILPSPATQLLLQGLVIGLQAFFLCSV